MRVKRGLTFGILILVLMSILIIGANSEIKQKSFEISSDILEKAEQGNVRVYIKLKTDIKNGRSIASENLKREITIDLKNVKHVFDDKISAIVSEEELLKLQNNSEIEDIEIIGMRHIDLQDSVSIINASPTWNFQKQGTNLTGTGQTVCIIDTGINYNHSDFGDCYGNNDNTSNCKVIGGWDYCADDTTCSTQDSDPIDVEGHGTHVAGIVAANGSLKGVAPSAKLIIIKAANSTGTFWDDDISAGINWCVDNASKFNISVISMSLGGSWGVTGYCDAQDSLSDEVDSAVANNISVIAATGNAGSTTQIDGPACIENATPVGGTDKNDDMYTNGNRNDLVLLLAPGVSINSTYISSSNSYATASGTSMSTPHIAGAFAIINQYRNLVGSPVMTPSEIEDALNDSGKVIYDSGGSGLNFSRIKIYQTLLDIDIEAPEITLTSPSNNQLSSNINQTFNCSAEDVLQLNNLTFYLWNSSGDLINQTVYNATSNNFGIEINITFENNGTYEWNCFAEDNKTNSNFSSSNYTIQIGGSSMSLNSPSNNSYSNSNSSTFNCSFETTVTNLSNVTLKIWNSSGLIYNFTSDVSGNSNESVIVYNLSTESENEWNCFAFDEDGNVIYSASNYTLTYDNTSPIVTLLDPNDNSNEDEGEITYEYSVSDLSDIENCSLYINTDLKDTDTSITKDTTQSFIYNTSDGGKEWYVDCYDKASNYGISAEWDLTVDAASSSSSGDDDDSSSSSSDDSSTTTTDTPATHVISDVDILKGIKKSMKEEDVMKFKIKEIDHILKLKDVTAESIKVVISSDPITEIINLNQTKKIDIDNDNNYEIEVSYEEYRGTYAMIRLKAIFEPVGTRQISNETNTSMTGNSIDGNGIMGSIFWTIIISIIVITIIAGGGYLIYLKKKGELGPIFEKKYKTLKK